MDTVRIEEAAQILGKSLSTVRKWIAEKRIPVVRRLGRVFFLRSELERIASQENIPAAVTVGK